MRIVDQAGNVIASQRQDQGATELSSALHGDGTELTLKIPANQPTGSIYRLVVRVLPLGGNWDQSRLETSLPAGLMLVPNN